ncbi:MAG: MSHA biogenesis protein MshI [Sulfurifustis sp.]
MKQQINLYRPIFRKQEKKFSAAAMLQAGAAILVGVLVIFALLAWQVRGMREEVRQADKQLAMAGKRVDEAAKRFGITAARSLADEVANLERQVAQRQQMLDVLTRGRLSNTSGYSEFFLAFARQHVPDVWITGVEIAGAGEDLRLQGRTTNPAQVPRYVQRLSAEQVLNGKEFQVFVLSRPPKKDAQAAESPYVEFLFKTAAQSEPGKS